MKGQEIANMLAIWNVPTSIRTGYRQFKHTSLRSKSTIFGDLKQTAVFVRKRSLPIFGDFYHLVSLTVEHPTEGIIYNIKLTKPPITEDDIDWDPENIPASEFHFGNLMSYSKLIAKSEKLKQDNKVVWAR
ncbi:hypothetical protein Acj9p048 [Acinetobacter phage Acj9]|uniref:Uncharacterized protein n=1 Tax=Acinetobacter phage Acj9 TaxID=760939 RepID=E5EPI2_9CAUD|nr:hypothetical protein Acj9p048 [Acinetobacter phage Acj9]ADG59948.1 hypothetical protein Acj9p048 [Acinetobacter phage Acj9]